MAVFIEAHSGNSESSIGQTSVFINVASEPGLFWYRNETLPVTYNDYVYYRIKYSLNNALTSPSYSAAYSDLVYTFMSNTAFENDIQLTGLTANTTYYYILQQSDDNSTWYDALPYPGYVAGIASGSFTTNTSAAPPTAAFTVQTASMTSGTAILAVRFLDSATGTPVQWAWAFGAGEGTASASDSADASVWHAYYTAGTYTVTQTVTNADGSDSEVKSGYIYVAGGLPNGAFTASPTSGVRPLTVTFTDGSTNYPTSWKWAIPDGVLTNLFTSQHVTHTYNVAGTYAATHTATSYLGSASVATTNAITVKPISVAATFTGGPLTGEPPLSVQFYGTPSGDSTGVLWTFGDGSTTTENNPTHAYTTNGANTVSYVVYGTTAAGGAATSVSTASRASYVTVAQDLTYKVLLEELRTQLLMNKDLIDVCSDFVEWGGPTTILRYIYNRICRLQLEVGLVRKTSTTITPTAAGVLTLPADLVEIRSIYANGNRIEKCDPRMGDLANQDWQTSPAGDYLGWFVDPSDHLTINFVPAITPSTFECYYVYAPAEPTVPSPCTNAWTTLPIPYVYWWIVKYGVLADMLNHEGEMYDVERATLCEKLFAEGVELAKLSLGAQ
jgi:PKD repeat protein